MKEVNSLHVACTLTVRRLTHSPLSSLTNHFYVDFATNKVGCCRLRALERGLDFRLRGWTHRQFRGGEGATL